MALDWSPILSGRELLLANVECWSRSPRAPSSSDIKDSVMSLAQPSVGFCGHSSPGRMKAPQALGDTGLTQPGPKHPLLLQSDLDLKPLLPHPAPASIRAGHISAVTPQDMCTSFFRHKEFGHVRLLFFLTATLLQKGFEMHLKTIDTKADWTSVSGWISSQCDGGQGHTAAGGQVLTHV